jgi:hypothetical protein
VGFGFGSDYPTCRGNTHGWTERHVIQKLAKIAERTAIEQLLVASHPAGDRNIDPGGYQYLSERERDSSAQLILTEERVRKEMPLQRIEGIVIPLAVARATRGTRLWPKRQVRVIRHRRRQMFIEKCLKIDLLYARDEPRRRSECGLLEETHRIRR